MLNRYNLLLPGMKTCSIILKTLTTMDIVGCVPVRRELVSKYVNNLLLFTSIYVH